MSKIYVILVLVVVSVIGAGCRITAPVTSLQNVLDSIYIERYDTIVRFAPDTATIALLLECDSAGNVLLLELEQAQGKNLSLQAKLNKTVQGTMLSVECQQDSLEQVIEGLREKIRRLSLYNEERVREVRYIPPFYKACTWITCISASILIIYIIIKIAIKIR